MTLTNYISLLIILNNEKHLQASGTFNTGYSKKAIPEKCEEFEKKDLDKIILSEDSIVKIKDIENYFIKNQRARKVIAYTGNQKFLDSLSKLKFKPTYDNLERYLKFLFLTTEGKESYIFGHEMNKLFSFNLINNHDPIFSDNPNYLDTLPFEFSFNKKRELKEKIKVKDFNEFIQAIQEKDFEFVEKCIYNEDFVNALIFHKSFKNVIKTISLMGIEDKDKIFCLFSHRIPFITKDYNLFEDINYFSLGNFLYDKTKKGLEKSSLLERIVDLLSEEFKIKFFNNYSNYFYEKDISEEHHCNFFRLLEKNILYIPNNTRVKLNLPTFEPVRTPLSIQIQNSFSDYGFVNQVSTLSISVDTFDGYSEIIKDCHLKKIDCSDIEFVENKNIKEVYLSNIYISSGIIDLSAFPNLKYISVNNTFFIKEIILNKNIKSLNVLSTDLNILDLIDTTNFTSFKYNNLEIK